MERHAFEAFHYSLRRPPASSKPGSHRGGLFGEEGLYAGSEPLSSRPVRRFDLRATLLDPWRRLHVQRFQNRSQTLLVAVVDRSRSMVPKLDLIKALVSSIAYSAYQHHDRFSLWIATDRPRCLLPPSRFGGMVPLAARMVEKPPPEAGGDRTSGFIRFPKRFPIRSVSGEMGGSVQALLEIAARLPHGALVFLISDLFFADGELERIAAAFGRHDTVPVVVWSQEEQALPSRYGWFRLRDPESGRERKILLRPEFAASFRQRLEERKRLLEERFRSYGRRPLFLDLPFSAKQLTRYFRS